MGLLSTPMEDNINYYDPEAWQICRTCKIVRTDQLTACPIKNIRETSNLKDLHNNGEPKADSRLSIWFLK